MAMHDDTDFEFEIGPSTPSHPATRVNPLASAKPGNLSGRTPSPRVRGEEPPPTHHFHTSSGTVTVTAHDVRAALIAALADAHRRLND